MCGISGLYIFGSPGITDAHVRDVETMTRVLAHRGPDSQGIWHDDKVALGHCRLSIIDLSDDGNQPMVSSDERYVIVYNGEIYNFIELRDEIIADAGYSFSSSSDTEVILQAIRLWGLDKTLPKLNGMFAFALWDRQRKTLSLARDSAGIKPLFYAPVSGGFLFASELKAIKASGSFKAEIDENALGEYFSQLYISHPRTIYKNCFRVSPGEIITIDSGGALSRSSFTPLSSLSRDLSGCSGDELIGLFEDTLDKAVQRHRRADVPVASFLSGGNDSALVSALLRKSGDFRTFSIGYEEKDFDESGRAEEIATHLSLPHEKIIVRPQDAGDVLDRITDFYDEPFADASAIPTHLISSHVKGFTKVALSGDGADELFGGYPRYFNAINEWNRLKGIPVHLRPLVSSLIPQNPPDALCRLLKPALKDAKKSLPHIRQILLEPSVITYFLRQNYLGLEGGAVKNAEILDGYRDYLAGLNIVPGNTLRTLLDFDQGYRLPDGMLTKVDRASMAASLEVRVPFLDNDMVALSRSLPDSYIVPRSGQCKKLLKDVLRRYLPDSIVDAPKTGFHIPMKIWLRTHFQDWANDLLFADEQDPYLNMRQVRVLWKDYAENQNNAAFYPLWCVLMYKQWLRKAAL